MKHVFGYIAAAAIGAGATFTAIRQDMLPAHIIGHDMLAYHDCVGGIEALGIRGEACAATYATTIHEIGYNVKFLGWKTANGGFRMEATGQHPMAYLELRVLVEEYPEGTQSHSIEHEISVFSKLPGRELTSRPNVLPAHVENMPWCEDAVTDTACVGWSIFGGARGVIY